MSFEQKQYWLKGVEYERERIIKLLQQHKEYLWKATEAGQVDVVPNVEMFERMIKLIGKEDDANNTD